MTEPATTTTVSFQSGPTGLNPLIPRPLDRAYVVNLDPNAPEEWERMDEAKIFAAPDDPADYPRWRAVLRAWRADARKRLSFDDSRYSDPPGAWARDCFAVAQVWLWDELLYDFERSIFTPDRLLADADDRFGGFDGIVLWHAYPVIGIDERNQWDFYREVPVLADLVQTLHDRGIAVFVDYNPWDTGTRRADVDLAELPKLITETGADGVFLDTLKEGDPALVSALEAARPGIGLESESKLPLARIAEHRLSWAQWFEDSPTPGVLRSHWFERRHQQHHIRRWHRDHADELQSAFVNGTGMMVWEVVFGVWVGWNERDARTLKRMLTIQRAASRWLTDGDWTPLATLHPEAVAASVSASAFELDGVTLYTIVNRGDRDYSGPVLPLPEPYPFPEPVEGPQDGTMINLTPGPVPAAGVAAIIIISPDAPTPEWVAPVTARLAELPHVASATFPYREAVRTTPTPSTAPADPTAIVVPAGDHRLTVRYRMRETGIYNEAPFVNEWKPLPPRLHDQRTVERAVVLDHPVAVARQEVSETDYAHYLAEHGKSGPVSERPASGIDLEEARAYAAWCGARLPTEDEWQLAAEQAPELFGRRAPLVWNLTESEHSDGRTRFVQLKGGSDFQAIGSEWYFDGGPQTPDFTAKFLMPGHGQARSPWIGFRLAWDLPLPEPVEGQPTS